MNRRDRLLQLREFVLKINATPSSLIYGGYARANDVTLREMFGDFADGGAGYDRFNTLMRVAVQNGYLMKSRAETRGGYQFDCYEVTAALMLLK